MCLQSALAAKDFRNKHFVAQRRRKSRSFLYRKTIVSETHSITFFPEGHAVSWKLPKNAQFGQFFFLLKVCVKRVGAYVIIS